MIDSIGSSGGDVGARAHGPVATSRQTELGQGQGVLIHELAALRRADGGAEEDQMQLEQETMEGPVLAAAQSGGEDQHAIQQRLGQPDESIAPTGAPAAAADLRGIVQGVQTLLLKGVAEGLERSARCDGLGGWATRQMTASGGLERRLGACQIGIGCAIGERGGQQQQMAGGATALIRAGALEQSWQARARE